MDSVIKKMQHNYDDKLRLSLNKTDRPLPTKKRTVPEDKPLIKEDYAILDVLKEKDNGTIMSTLIKKTGFTCQQIRTHLGPLIHHNKIELINRRYHVVKHKKKGCVSDNG